MSTHSVISWALILGLGLAGVVYAADAREPLALLGAAAVVNLLLVAVALSERRALSAASAARSKVESTTARYMGLIWLWGAAALILVYTLILQWREWPHFSAAFAIAGLLCLGFSALLGADAAKGKDDATLLKLGRYMAIGQLGGMVATMIGLAIDPDKEFLVTTDVDWAGNGIFLFGALALAIVSAHALIDGKKNSS
jgi:hypothetical protein